MKVYALYNRMWAIWAEDDNQKLLNWIRDLKNKEPNSLDVGYVYLEVLSGVNMDFEHDQEEPKFIQHCTEVLRNKEKHDTLTLAKAYSYRGEIRYYAIDRRRDFDKALILLKTLDQNDKEVLFIKDFIALAYPLNVRQYLFFNVNALNMYKAD